MADTAKSGGCTTDIETMDFVATENWKKVLIYECYGKVGAFTKRHYAIVHL